jgi:hypothetical protein
MSIEGRINVDCLFHDKDGQRLKVVSLQSTNTNQTVNDKVAIVTGTAGTALTTLNLDNVYRNAAGDPVFIGAATRVLYSWNGTNEGQRTLELIDFDDFASCRLISRNRQVAVSTVNSIQYARLTASSGNTGTYTIVIYGT